uniref:Four and a half LIM domains 3b n=1 Tax=Mastacembelus armatus TaxID=205130 RepID=A0A3Q3LQN0_9TELE
HPGNRALELFYENRYYHEHCFRCFRCDRSLADEPFTSQEEALVCSDCYCNEFSSKCVACDKTALTKGGVTYKDEIWHKECFFCTSCKMLLAGQPFTSQGESPYCVKCFSSLYAKKCAGCNTAITGFGDGKYVSFEDRQWHQPCFKCSRCSVSLVGSGFFPDRDQILCTDCNNDD